MNLGQILSGRILDEFCQDGHGRIFSRRIWDEFCLLRTSMAQIFSHCKDEFGTNFRYRDNFFSNAGQIYWTNLEKKYPVSGRKWNEFAGRIRDEYFETIS